MKKRMALILGAMVLGSSAGAVTALQGNTEGAAIVAEAADTAENTDASQKNGTDYTTVSTTSLVNTENSGVNYSGVADIAEAAMPSIVAITNKSVQEVQSFYRGQSYQYESESSGSGIIVGQNDSELLICTNNHVVEDASELTVSFIDESSYTAQVKGTDASNDLAVIAVKLEDLSDDTLSKIQVAQMGDSDELRVGEQVVAIGNALGYGQSVTTGIVSAKDRTIEVNDDYGTVSAYENLIQTDAAINPGNSGGALLNMKGELIGINSAKASSSGVEGMGYAIPVSKASPILEQLMSQETRSLVDEEDASYIGIGGDSVSAEAVRMYGVPAGVYVSVVYSDSPAEKAGVQEGDIITAFDGVTVSSLGDLQKRLQYYAADETVDLTVQRMSDKGGYEETTLSITLGKKSDFQNS
ncbi:MAG: trypsin-like peptidase domain-containing protein [Eubacteriales bacterium]|nr:trypsin-like peptidase domain-containing protein [Eubacteriales bacterium]